LASVAQGVIDQNKRKHRFCDGHGPEAHAWIVPTRGNDIRGVAVNINGLTRYLYGRGWLQSETHRNGLTTGDSTQHTAGLIT
jgi:hypothetical protein